MFITLDKKKRFLVAFSSRRLAEQSWKLTCSKSEVILEHMDFFQEEVRVVSCAGNVSILGYIKEVHVYQSMTHL